MFRKISVCLLTVLMLMSLTAMVAAHGKKKPVKKGILLVSFGTSVPEAQVAFKHIEEKVKAEFPNVPLRWAYTSHIIRHKLAKEGQQLDSVEIALAKMMEEGFTHVAVQSFHIIGGEEFHIMHQNVKAFAGMAEGIEKISIGYPLLSTQDDLQKVTEAVIANIPKNRKKDEAVVLMGHGTPHPSNAFYPAMMYYLQQKDPNLFIGTVEGTPTIDDIKTMLTQKGIKKAYLIPFMSVAGDHARNDMSGDEKESWKNILGAAGISCEPVLKGLAEYDNIVAIWIEHLKKAYTHFD
ncbi:MAG: sirohydrochlorin cobaltochelatase [Desulfobacterales bacterium]|nr:sirohydrochlorin cobaltochelatase [Desulfobacterales bacterium]